MYSSPMTMTHAWLEVAHAAADAAARVITHHAHVGVVARLKDDASPVTVAAMATMGWLSGTEPVEPKKPASPKAKMPPSRAASQ